MPWKDGPVLLFYLRMSCRQLVCSIELSVSGEREALEEAIKASSASNASESLTDVLVPGTHLCYTDMLAAGRQEPLLGTFPYFSGKIAGAGKARGRCIAHMFAMRVAEELPTWPEGSTRKRVWVRLQLLPAFERCTAVGGAMSPHLLERRWQWRVFVACCKPFSGQTSTLVTH